MLCRRRRAGPRSRPRGHPTFPSQLKTDVVSPPPAPRASQGRFAAPSVGVADGGAPRRPTVAVRGSEAGTGKAAGHVRPARGIWHGGTRPAERPRRPDAACGRETQARLPLLQEPAPPGRTRAARGTVRARPDRPAPARAPTVGRDAPARRRLLAAHQSPARLRAAVPAPPAVRRGGVARDAGAVRGVQAAGDGDARAGAGHRQRAG